MDRAAKPVNVRVAVVTVLARYRSRRMVMSRIGSRGQLWSVPFATVQEAGGAFYGQRKAKEKRGYCLASICSS